ncbi:MAG: GxxExxY protein [Bacteroidales bacterium]|nr:GxxExxY protein [Candidatus Sodaliphilus fimicaballi]
MDIEALISKIIDCAMTVRKALAPGYLEKVYENALVYELKQQGIKAESQKELDVFYKGIVVGKYVADIVVENCVILELKAVQNINVSHESQLVNYLTATGIDHGLILNYGNDAKIEIRRKFRIYKTTQRIVCS